MSLINSSSHAASVFTTLSPEEIDMLRDAFIYMDSDNDGHLSRDELLAMVCRCVGDERFVSLKEYLVPLFNVADKDRDDKLSLTEFLMSFADGPGVVPSEVINSCVSSIRIRLTDEEIETLQETFRRIDTKSDGYIDKDELIAALKENLKYRFPDLQDNNFNDIVAVIMASADADRDGRLCLSEFIRSFQEDQGVLPAAFIDANTHRLVQQLTPPEIEVLKDAFRVLDRNHDGYLEDSDLYEALGEILCNSMHEKAQIRELCDLIMVAADKEGNGRLTLADFIRDFVRNISLLRLPIAAAQEKMRSSCEKLWQMLESGELERAARTAEDNADESSCVNPAQLSMALCDVFRDVFPSLDEEMLSAVVDAFVISSGNEHDRKITLDDFIRCFAEGPRILSSDSTVTQQLPGITDDDLRLVSQVLQELDKDVDEDGCVHEPDVLEAIRNACRSDSRQADRVLQYVRDNITRRNSSSSMVVEASVREGLMDSELISTKMVPPTESTLLASRQMSVSSPKPQTKPQPVGPLIPAPRQTQEAGSMWPLSSTRTVPKSLETRSFGSRATVSDVLMKQHARRYLESVYDTADSAVFEDELRMEFKKYAKDNQNYIDRDEFVRAYLAMEHYGLSPSRTEVEKLISRYSKGKKIMYEEFCIIMLQRARM